jgi:hypothetical protein
MMRREKWIHFTHSVFPRTKEREGGDLQVMVSRGEGKAARTDFEER